MLEMNVLEPGLATYKFGADGKASWTAEIPECFIAECGPELVYYTYPHLAHSWLMTGNLTKALVEGELWQIMDGSHDDDRVITSRINTILDFWDTYGVIMNRHFFYSAPVKEYRDITGVTVIEGMVRCAIWTIDSTLLESTALFDTSAAHSAISSQPEILVTELSAKYF